MVSKCKVMGFLLVSSLAWGVESEKETIKKLNWKNESGVSLISQSGNSDQETFNGNSKTTLNYKSNEVVLGGAYTYGEALERRNSENWNINLRYGYQFTDVFQLFTGELVEADRFAGIKRRYNTDLGGNFRLYKSANALAKIEAGYRYTNEKRTDLEERKDSKGRLFLMGERKITETLKGQTSFEYLPNFTVSEDYQMNWDTSASFFISSNFSLKMSYLWRFDNQPTAGKVKYDRTTTTTLVATF